MTAIMSTPPPPPKRKQEAKPSSVKVESPVLSQSKRYEQAYMQVWTNLQKWKQVAIEDDRKQGIEDGRLMNEFLSEVTRIAEQS